MKPYQSSAEATDNPELKAFSANSPASGSFTRQSWKNILSYMAAKPFMKMADYWAVCTAPGSI
ncbi:hypothetical protein [Mucilaginibacter sp. L3T2-6]|uniref:hypothetical protein n=1 Tax=Mucilaginibacter sp. L3T2-6 TaxID=3062491 RepID=UPI002674E282|nr:hypothetical protein [Mucilaginibacter sp. L3T2-6]MDO3645248.1 hypothetical protein [Mucilaginibacter sp. L3T2-6]MDV6217700.1 hypothetical protein [Mucilaginibacter sp. L3T2-6]